MCQRWTFIACAHDSSPIEVMTEGVKFAATGLVQCVLEIKVVTKERNMDGYSHGHLH